MDTAGNFRKLRTDGFSLNVNIVFKKYEPIFANMKATTFE
jgi:hypothetical protein